MNFDIVEVLTGAWKITWKHKVLWIFGILASCGRGGGGGNGSNSGGRIQPNGGPFSPGDPTQNPMFKQMIEFFDKAGSWILENSWVIVAFVVLVLVLWLLQIFLSTVGNIGLIRGVYHAEMGVEKINFGELFSESLRYFWRTIGLQSVVLLPVIIILIGILAILFFSLETSAAGGSDSGSVAFFLLVAGLCCSLVPIGVGLALYYSQAVRALILEDLGVFSALSRGWQVFSKNIIGLLIMGVIFFIINLLIGLAIAIPIYIIVFPLMIDFMQGNIDSWQPFIITGIVILLYSPIAWLLNGVLLTYFESAWTLVYMRIAKPKESAPVIVAPNA